VTAKERLLAKQASSRSKTAWTPKPELVKDVTLVE